MIPSGQNAPGDQEPNEPDCTDVFASELYVDLYDGATYYDSGSYQLGIHEIGFSQGFLGFDDFKD